MKRMLILAAATVIFASCSKEYTCDCINPATNEENHMVYYTNKKAHATRLCEDWATRQRAAIPENSNVSCSLK